MKLERGELHIVAIDTEGNWLAEGMADNRSSARKLARAWISDRELIDSGLRKVELRLNGECLQDWFT